MDQYRIKFYLSAEVRIDPFDLAWFIAKNNIEVVGKTDGEPTLFVKATEEDLIAFMAEVNHDSGPLIFKQVAMMANGRGYMEVDL